jgi:tetratricopeptide (TPR) repeat protein
LGQVHRYSCSLWTSQTTFGVARAKNLEIEHLGALYKDQGKMAEAEEMYMRALRGKEKAWGAEHTSTLDMVHNLGVLYADQGKMAEADEMYVRALRRYEKAVGKDHPRTQKTASNLQRLYARK